MHSLAIVIPAFKPDFFRVALESLDCQTDRRFRVYVGNDGGPESLESICADFPGLDLEYSRFPDNLGGSSLTEHWDRCVSMSHEPWVWLFADDDVMAHDCVASFYASLEDLDGHDIVRFNTSIIDAEGATVQVNPPHPPVESGADFVFSRLKGDRSSFAVEYIFRRRAYEAVGGFPDYPAAWCADDASWCILSRRGGIRTLGTGRVYWRASGLNISDMKRHRSGEKLAAITRYLHFVDREVRPNAESEPSDGIWVDVERSWLLDQIWYLMPMSPALCRIALRESRAWWPLPTIARAGLLAWWNSGAAIRTAVGTIRSGLSSERS